jgi:hypothetical protein
MNTTLNEIREFLPCEPSWEQLLKSLNKTKADDEPLSFKYILDVLDIRDALWCLTTQSYKDQCLFLADVAESVLHIFEDNYPNDMRVCNCIDGIRKFHAGEITEDDLLILRCAAVYAVYTTDLAAAAAANTSICTSDSSSHFVAYRSTHVSVNAHIDAGGSFDAKWEEIEELFIKHFCNELGE